MNTRTIAVLASILGFGCLACLACSSSEPTLLTIAHVNDTHSHLESVGPKDDALRGTVGGLTRAATVIRRLRTEHPDTLLLLHAGDLFQGDVFFNATRGVPELTALASLGFDAAVVGNHELGYGAEFLATALEEAWPAASAFPFLSANLDVTDAPGLAGRIQSRLVKRVAGVKVGLFGLTVPDDATTFPEPARLLGGDDPAVLVAIASEQVAALRAEGAQLVVLLSHLGLATDRRIASEVGGIDVVVGGHDHAALSQPVTVTAKDGGRTLVVQAGEFYDHVGRLTLSVQGGKATLQGYELIPVDESQARDPAIVDLLAPLEEGIVAAFGDLFHDLVGWSAHGVSARYDGQAAWRDVPAANLVADAMRAATGTEVALTTAGLVSESLPAGAVTAADVFRMVSYGLDPESGLGLQLATFRLTGAELVRALETGLAMGGADATPQVSGMRYAFDARRAAGERLLLDQLSVGGAPLDPEAHYSVSVNTGLLTAMTPLALAIEDLEILAVHEYEAVVDHLRHASALDAAPEGRVVDVSVQP